jgi:hypothetical protein
MRGRSLASRYAVPLLPALADPEEEALAGLSGRRAVARGHVSWRHRTELLSLWTCEILRVL